jgi:hypothetical protein
VGAYHPKGGKINLIEIIPRTILINCEEVGGMLATTLNRKGK